MRSLSAHNMKRNTTPKHMIPAEGTRLRRLWDALQANRGHPVYIKDFFAGCKSAKAFKYHAITQFRDFWGLDICYARTMWTLLGEWKGRDYHDYRIKTKGPVREGVQADEPAQAVPEVPFWGS